MTRHEAMRLNQQEATLCNLGFTPAEVETLRRISRTLHTWAEAECNGDIERADNGDGVPYRSLAATGGKHLAYRIPDRERGALRRLHALLAQHPTLTAYVQGDPRGCALYILRPGDVPDGQPIDSYYNRGLAVY